MHEHLVVIIALIICLGTLAQWLSWWLKLPSILLLLLIGIVAGPVTGILQPDRMFGDLLFPLISFGVALVLFEGALTLQWRNIREHGPMVTNLVSWGAALNWLLIAGGTWLFTDLQWITALLFGALVVVTGPTVIMPLLRTVRPNQTVSNILRWEGILIDPLGALFAVLVFEVISSEVRGNSYLMFIREIATGMLCGGLGAVFIAQLLKRYLLPEYLHNVFTLAVVIGVFSLANHFADESGLLAVTLMGIWLANTKGIEIRDILSFKESLSVLIISLLFIVLAARTDLRHVLTAGWGATGVLLAVVLARPVVVWASAIGSNLSWREKALIAWIAPRGIVAAAMSSLFAIKLELLGYSEAHLVSALTFLVIIATVVLQSLTARPVARWLGVAEEEPKGILIVGANSVSRAVGLALMEHGFRIKVADTNWDDIQEARMAGLDTYYGNAVSAHADRHLDLIGIGRIFAMSRRPALNALACLKYRNEFGRRRVFTLRNAEEKDDSEKNRIADTFRAPRLFGEDITAQKLASLIGQGAEIKSTRLSESFGIEEYQRLYGSSAIPLFVVDNKKRLRAFTDQYTPELKPDAVLIALLPKAVREGVGEPVEKIPDLSSSPPS